MKVAFLRWNSCVKMKESRIYMCELYNCGKSVLYRENCSSLPILLIREMANSETSITKFTLFERKCKENRYSNGVVHFKLSWLLLLRESSEPNKIVFHQTIPPFSSWKSTITRTKLQITDLWAKSLFILNARDITSVWPLRLNVCH